MLLWLLLLVLIFVTFTVLNLHPCWVQIAQCTLSSINIIILYNRVYTTQTESLSLGSSIGWPDNQVCSESSYSFLFCFLFGECDLTCCQMARCAYFPVGLGLRNSACIVPSVLRYLPPLSLPRSPSILSLCVSLCLPVSLVLSLPPPPFHFTHLPVAKMFEH